MDFRDMIKAAGMTDTQFVLAVIEIKRRGGWKAVKAERPDLWRIELARRAEAAMHNDCMRGM